MNARITICALAVAEHCDFGPSLRSRGHRARHRRQLHPRRERPLFQRRRQGRRLRQIHHHRDRSPIDNQTVIRLNRDTLYSAAVFDLDAGPVTITLPDAGERFMSLQVINEDQYTPPAIYDPGRTPSRRRRSARATSLSAVRTLVDPADPPDVEQGQRCRMRSRSSSQAARASSKCRIGTRSARRRCAMRLLVLATTMTDTSKAFGTKEEVDPVQRLIGSGLGLGRQPAEGCHLSQLHAGRRTTATPSTSSTSRTCRSTASGRSVSTTPTAISRRTTYDAYSLNNITAKKKRGWLGRHPVRRLRRQDRPTACRS